MLDPSEFLAEAQALAVGEKRKIRHLCGDASLVVYNNVDSWSAWCWRCHMRGWVGKPEPTMAERAERKRQQEAIDNAIRTVNPPRPEVTDLSAWPASARLWLYKAGLNAQHIRALGAYYHAGSDRVVLPVRGADGSVVFWQARNCDYPRDIRPKYVSASVPRDRVHCQYPAEHQAGRPVVLCEDILSAFKVGLSGVATGYAVMGTTLSDHTVALLVRLGAPVLTWYDPDNAGSSARNSSARGLRYVGLDVAHIHTARDPKSYCLREIREIVNELRPQPATDLPESQAILSAVSDAEREGGGP